MRNLLSVSVVCERPQFAICAKPVREVQRLIDDLDLNCIKFKLMHNDEGEPWNRERIDRVENAYRRFLFLSVTTGKAIVPTKDIDTFWHQHILDTHKYAEDCEHMFGFFLHHFPYLGMRGESDAELLQIRFQETKALYEAKFGEAYGASPTDCENCGNCASSCGIEGCGERPTFESALV